MSWAGEAEVVVDERLAGVGDLPRGGPSGRRPAPWRAIADHLPVDFQLRGCPRGCPIDRRQLLEVITSFLPRDRGEDAAGC